MARVIRLLAGIYTTIPWTYPVLKERQQIPVSEALLRAREEMLDKETFSLSSDLIT